MGGNDALTSRQMALFTFVAQTGIGITMLPTYISLEIGHDGWISVLITGLLVILFGILIVVLLKRYSDKAIYDINKLLYGKIVGTVFNILLFVYLLCNTAASIRITVAFIRYTFFPMTPTLVMTVFGLLPSIYLVYKGVKTVARFKTMTLSAYIIAVVYLVLIYKEVRPTFLMPVGDAGILPILASTKTSYFAFIGLELIAVLYPHITDREKALKWHVYANLTSTLFIAAIVVVCTGVFGDKLLSTQMMPFFNLSRIYNAPILERVDIYVTAAWFVAMGCSVRAFMMCTYLFIDKAFRVKKSKPVYSVFIIALIIISRMPKDLNATLDFLKLINYASMGVTAFLVLSLIISLFKKKGVVQNETSN